jgi:hypothetical protein
LAFPLVFLGLFLLNKTPYYLSKKKIEKYALKYSSMLLSEFGILALLSKPIWFDVIAYAKFTFECRHRM